MSRAGVQVVALYVAREALPIQIEMTQPVMHPPQILMMKNKMIFFALMKSFMSNRLLMPANIATAA